jgi:hypothetical protein
MAYFPLIVADWLREEHHTAYDLWCYVRVLMTAAEGGDPVIVITEEEGCFFWKFAMALMQPDDNKGDLAYL